jgi:hypothetical protein
MNHTEMGAVFGYLLRWREIAGNPPGRNLREGERDAARALANSNSSAHTDFEDFLNAQGFSLVSRDGVEFGIPPKPNTPNTIWALTRKRGEDPAPYVDNRWYIDMMRDRRGGDGEAKKSETVFWTARLWLMLQWFFYEKIDRLPSEVSRYREAMVSKRMLVEELASGIEKMGNAGRPTGEAGIAWDFFWKDKKNISTWTGRFLTVMEDAGMIQSSGNKDEWHQTVLAAIEMADNASHEIAYLLPPKDALATTATAALLLGENPAALTQAS